MAPSLPRFNDANLSVLTEAVRQLQLQTARIDHQRVNDQAASGIERIIRQITVVVVQRPEIDHTQVVVREVRYATLPPRPPTSAQDSPDAIAANLAAQEPVVQPTRRPLIRANRPIDPADRDTVESFDQTVRPAGERPVPDPTPPLPPDPPFEPIPPIDLPHDQYEWSGPPFIAWPDFGHVAYEYDSAFWDVELDGQAVPQLDTKFLRCRREHDSWIVELESAAAVSFAVVRGWPDPEGHVLYVQRIQKPLPFVGAWEVAPLSAIQDVFTFGGLRAKEYIQHQWLADELFDYTPIVPLLYDGQHTFALHTMKFLVGTYRPALNAFRVTDCYE